MISSIFKVPVYVTELNLDLNSIKKVCNTIVKKDTGRIISNVGGYQSNDLDNDNDLIKILKDDIETHANKFAEEFNNKATQKLDNLWLNCNKYRDTNIPHIHVGAYLSGVYYIDTPKDCGNITFQHPAKLLLEYYYRNQQVSEYNTLNSMEWDFKPVANTLYLFPSWLSHYVQENKNKTKTRISVSFNTMNNE